MITPIIVATQTDCIVVSGKKYCEDTDMTPKELGFFILFFIAIFIYFGMFLKASDRWQWAWIPFWGLPLTTAAVLLIIYG